jgi:hypothetical protein
MAATSLPLPLAIVLSAAPEKAPLEDPRSDASLHSADKKNSSLFFDRKIQMHGSSLELHLAHPGEVHPPNLLVLYASGDGGWFGAAVKMFEDLTQLGYPAVGFSARSYKKLLGYGDASVSVDSWVRTIRRSFVKHSVAEFNPNRAHLFSSDGGRELS